jgi:hypothetical protein
MFELILEEIFEKHELELEFKMIEFEARMAELNKQGELLEQKLRTIFKCLEI